MLPQKNGKNLKPSNLNNELRKTFTKSNGHLIGSVGKSELRRRCCILLLHKKMSKIITFNCWKLELKKKKRGKTKRRTGHTFWHSKKNGYVQNDVTLTNLFYCIKAGWNFKINIFYPGFEVAFWIQDRDLSTVILISWNNVSILFTSTLKHMNQERKYKSVTNIFCMRCNHFDAQCFWVAF